MICENHNSFILSTIYFIFLSEILFAKHFNSFINHILTIYSKRSIEVRHTTQAIGGYINYSFFFFTPSNSESPEYFE